MVVFTMTAQLLDTLLIKGIGLTADAALYVVTWSAKSVWKWAYPPTIKSMSETEQLKKEIEALRDELHHNIHEDQHKDQYGNTFVIINEKA